VSKTGWKPNEKDGWFFSGKQQKPKAWPGMVYVEGGTFTMGLVEDNVMHDWNNTPRRMQVSSFFIGDTEITNSEYREYTTWLKFVFPSSDPSLSTSIQVLYQILWFGITNYPVTIMQRLTSDLRSMTIILWWVCHGYKLQNIVTG
jgi:formylglycine-generating enzyme required for sulfatase activity